MDKQNEYALIASFQMKEKWNASTLSSFISIGMSGLSEKEEKKFDMYYMRIYGYYDPRLCDDNRAYELSSMSNHITRELTNFNRLKNDTDTVLLLRSKYKDFRSYEAISVYKSDKRITDDNVSLITIVGEYKSSFKMKRSLVNLFRSDKNVEEYQDFGNPLLTIDISKGENKK